MDNQMLTSVVTKKKETRQDKAAGLVKSVVKNQDGNTFSVPSQTNKDKVYEVVHYGHKFGCSCPDFLCRDVEACKHIYAVKLFIIQQQKEEEPQQQKATATTTTTMTKTFNSFTELNNWVNSELNNKLYKIGRINWVENTVKLEGRKMSL